MQPSSLVLLVEEIIPPKVYADFESDLTKAGIPFLRERREGGPYASLALAIPSAIAILLAKPFFDSIMKKAGEDAYPTLKAALIRLVCAAAKLRLKVVGKQPSAQAEQFSLAISFYSHLTTGRNVKFLVNADVDERVYQIAVDMMCDLLVEHFSEAGGNDRLTQLVGNSKALGGLSLLRFDVTMSCWVVLEIRIP